MNDILVYLFGSKQPIIDIKFGQRTSQACEDSAGSHQVVVMFPKSQWQVCESRAYFLSTMPANHPGYCVCISLPHQKSTSPSGSCINIYIILAIYVVLKPQKKIYRHGQVCLFSLVCDLCYYNTCLHL